MKINPVKNNILLIELYIYKIETIVLVSSVTVMIFLGALQVLLRNFFNTGIEWGDMLVRALVLWVGFIGASLATRRSRHINIDVCAKIITGNRLSKIRKRTVDIISFVLVFILAYSSWQYFFIEIKNNMKAFLDIPTWVILIVVPISLSLISLRLLIHSIINHDIETDAEKESLI